MIVARMSCHLAKIARIERTGQGVEIARRALKKLKRPEIFTSSLTAR